MIALRPLSGQTSRKCQPRTRYFGLLNRKFRKEARRQNMRENMRRQYIPMLAVVPQLSKWLKVEAVWGVLIDQMI